MVSGTPATSACAEWRDLRNRYLNHITIIVDGIHAANRLLRPRIYRQCTAGRLHTIA